ncbi:MAG: hypothetical protein ACYCU5_13235 [Actinomycetes bacterium]
MHGGKAPQVVAAAAVRLTEERLAVRLRDLVGVPVDDPLGELLRLAGTARSWQDFLTGEVERLDRLDYTDKTARQDARALVQLFERSLDRLGRLLVDISRLGIEERLARVEEARLVLLAGVVRGALADVGLDAERSEAVQRAVARRLREVAS